MIRSVLLLGDPRLVAPCREVERDELGDVKRVAEDLRDTLLEFRREHGVGRGIAAPQIAEPVRLVYLHWPEERVLINPVLDLLSEETFELWDDCMSFPEVLVRVRRHRSCRLTWSDLDWQRHELEVDAPDLAELLQHEVDHLDGILAVARAVEPQALALRGQLEAMGELPERYGDARATASKKRAAAETDSRPQP